MENMTKIKITIGMVYTSIMMYFFMPILRLDFIDLTLGAFILSLIYLILDIIVENLKKSTLIMLGVSLSLLTIVPIVSSWSLFYASDYNKVLENNNKIKISDFNKDVSVVDISKVRTVNQTLAIKLGSKKLGEDLALGSIVTLGEFSIQKVSGELFWVAPLEHSGFFKWLNSKKGTTGYVMVSATNGNDVRLVQDKGNIVYQPSAYFSENLERHIYFNDYMNVGFTDYSFEINDEGKPYWVLSKYEKKIGFFGEDVVGTIIIDAETGDIKEYTIDETPVWVDRIQPESFITTQLNDWGIYKKGWANANFAKESLLTVTPGMSLVYGDDGKSYWYTGLTSAGSDGSTVGFVLVNTRTKETFFYKVSGATENRAMSSAQGIVQEKGYVATAPILYNVLGTPTYILTLKDNEGLVKNIAMVNVQNYSIVGIGIDVKSALRNYRSKILSKGNNIELNSLLELKKLEGLVSRINSDVKSGQSYYYLKIEGKNKLFTLDSTLSEDIILTKEGDKVEIEYEDTDMKYISISKFINLNL